MTVSREMLLDQKISMSDLGGAPSGRAMKENSGKALDEGGPRSDRERDRACVARKSFKGWIKAAEQTVPEESFS